jgi:IS605 OrfB family transposase
LCPRDLKEPILCWEKLPDLIHDPKIHKDRWGDYWLLVPIDKPIRARKDPSSLHRFVSLDPGEKAFQTAYSTEGDVMTIGSNNRGILLALFQQIDRLQSMLDRHLFHGRTLRHVREKVMKLWKRVGNLVNDQHWKVAHQLTEENDLIVLGKLGVKSILQDSSITKAVKRVLQTQGHYRFRMRLQEKGEEMGVPVIVWSEWGTTKGCPCCGRSVQVGSSRQFVCPHCSYQAGRDAKAGCCIMIKYLSNTW